MSTRKTWSAETTRGIETSGAFSLRTTSTMTRATRSGSSRIGVGVPVNGKPSVGDRPGFTLVTRTPVPASSWYRASLKATTPCFVAP